jgi:hypothetical protein
MACWAGQSAVPLQLAAWMSVTASGSHTAFAQTVPLLRRANEHDPSAGLQTPAASHALGARQTTGAPAWHLPALSHLSLCVHALLSALHPTPPASGEHVPSLPDTLQATQSPAAPLPQVVSQQKPSMQLPEVHSLHPATLQWPPLVPDAVLQAPVFFDGTQVPVLSQ